MRHTKIAHWRAWSIFVRWPAAWLRQCSRWMTSAVIDKRQRYPALSDHLAHDIGLDATDLTASRLRLPSQHTQHPYG